MACGVPCAVTDVGPSAAIVADTGVAVPPRDPQALAEVIVRLLGEGPESLARRSETARERIAAHLLATADCGPLCNCSLITGAPVGRVSAA